MTTAKKDLKGTAKNTKPSTKQVPPAILEGTTEEPVQENVSEPEVVHDAPTPTMEVDFAMPELKPLEEGIGFDEQPKTAEDFKDFEGVEDSLIEVTGEENAPILELTEEDNLELLRKQQDEQERAERIGNATVRFDNGSNIWRLISQTLNPLIRSENTVMAMQIGRTRGVMVMIKDGNDYKMNITSVYIDNGTLEEVNGKWFLK